MATETFTFSYIGILIAALVGYAIGALWYSPILFGNIWMKELGISKKDIEKSKKKDMTMTYMLSFVATLIMAIVLFVCLEAFRVDRLIEALIVSFFLWLGFIAVVMLNMIFWESKSFRLYFINSTHYLTVMLVMGIILYLF